MSVTVNVNATNYTIPETGDENWGDQVTAWIQSVSLNMLQKTGGLFTLSADADFGPNFGLESIYYKSRTANEATTGIVRFANADQVVWRNVANTANLGLGVGTADGLLAYNGVNLVTISATQTLTSKTLTSPILTTPTVGGGSIDTTGAGAFTAFGSVGAFNLNVGGSTTTVVIPGNLQVDGTSVVLNTTTLDVEDINITVNKNGNDATSEGAGLRVERTGTHGSLIYATAAASKFKIGSLASEVEIADISSVQAFTNKTYSGSLYSLPNQTEARFFEATGNGTNYVALKGPDAITTDFSLKLPSADGSAGQFLSTNGAGVLSFAAAAGTASGLTTTDTSSASQTVVAGNTLTHPFLTIDTPHTYTVNASARLLTVGTLTINGSLVVNGTHIAMNTD